MGEKKDSLHCGVQHQSVGLIFLYDFAKITSAFWACFSFLNGAKDKFSLFEIHVGNVLDDRLEVLSRATQQR